jgi:aspartyl-tRNA(Asn)/glutamyl-tRNA(Gln) amidotransferase subunit A
MTPERLDGFDHFFRMRFWAETKDLAAEHYERILPYIRQWVEGATSYEALTVYDGYSQLVAIREEGVRASQAYDYLLSPVSPMAAFAAELPSPSNDPARPFDHISYTMPFNMTEQPASSINCGYTSDGLPIGLQIVGKRFDDMGVLRLSHWFEQARDEQRPWEDMEVCRVAKTKI